MVMGGEEGGKLACSLGRIDGCWVCADIQDEE